jgi:hypothetical protein
MRYSKPEVVFVGDALAAIQHGLSKNSIHADNCTVDDNATSPAYEADE